MPLNGKYNTFEEWMESPAANTHKAMGEKFVEGWMQSTTYRALMDKINKEKDIVVSIIIGLFDEDNEKNKNLYMIIVSTENDVNTFFAHNTHVAPVHAFYRKYGYVPVSTYFKFTVKLCRETSDGTYVGVNL